MSYTRSVLVTGGTTGLGFQCALDIARKHPEYQVVISSRNDPNNAAISINTTLKQNNVTFLPLDLSDLAKVRSFAEVWETNNFPPIQALVLNAALQFPNEIHTNAAGIESTFAVSHVGHALLFHLLYAHLADKARIVITSSGTHDPAQKSGLPDAVYKTAEDLAHPPPEMIKIDGRQRYSSSKLANVMWGYALDRRFQSIRRQGKKNLTVVSMDPGLMPGTGLAREYNAFLRFLWVKIMPKILPVLRVLIGSSNIHSQKESGENLSRLAISPDVEGESGTYFEGNKKIPSSVDSYDEEKQEDFWGWTLKHVATNEEELRTFELVN
ncbi:hypothetical protein G7Y89_g15506 [Cudoniella acicularis]|uniref:Protochlorophyllide reductase n=1 Tax=Cudoniella acicularis TaxID=354080 RepID=A0A8H4QM27_9HELO|nr:hypothetical protein G7Y89_g15506 [Cudoniella acicularis]